MAKINTGELSFPKGLHVIRDGSGERVYPNPETKDFEKRFLRLARGDGNRGKVVVPIKKKVKR